MKHSKLITLSTLLVAVLLITFIGCENRVFEPDQFEIVSLTYPDTLNSGVEGTIEAQVVTKNGGPAVDQTVSFKANRGIIQGQATTNEFGLARVKYFHNVQDDPEDVTIEASIHQSTKVAHITVVPFVGEYVITSLTADPATIYADGNITYSIITAKVEDSEGFPVVEETVRFKTSPVGSVISLVMTDERGIATTTLWDSNEVGTATVSAHIGPASASVIVEIVETPEIESITIVNELADLSLETEMTLRAQVMNILGDPVADGTLVTFTATKGEFEDNINMGTTSNGQASVPYNTGLSAGDLTVTARVGNVTGEKQGNINPGLPAYVSLVPQIRDETEEWIDMPPEGIPVNYEYDVRVRATIRDMYNNPVPRKSLEFETDLAGIQPFAETDETGAAYATFYPGTSAGTAQITARTVQVGEGGEPVTGMTMITIYSEEVNSITFSTQEEIFLDVIGVGGVTSRQLRVELRDHGGNLVTGQHMVTFEIIGANPPAGANINNEGLSAEIRANNGHAVASINSGTGSGTVRVRVSLSENPDINATKSNIVIRSGPPVSVQPTVSDFDEGISMGGGIWRIEAGAFVRDIHNNPVIDGTAVWFSLLTTPQPPADTYIEGAGYTGNPTPSFEDGYPGYAGTFLYYHGRNIYDQITIKAETGEITGTNLVTLPMQQPRLDLVVTPGHHDYFADDPPNAFQDGTIIIDLQDGQGNPTTGGEIKLTSTHGQFVHYPWFDGGGNMINDPNNPEIITTYNGTAKGYIRSFIWECPPPIDEYFTTIDVQITAFLIGTNTLSQTSFTIRRYIIDQP